MIPFRSREEELLLCCARLEVEPGAIGRLITPALDWGRLFELASRHGVAPLLHYHLAPLHAPMPSEIARAFKAAYYWSAAENRSLYQNLAELLEALSSAGIRALVLKGAAIASRVYPEVALRPMEDIDLLIREQELAAADGVLRAIGYVADESFAPSEWYEANHHHLAPYYSADRLQIVELHRHIARFEVTHQIPVSDLWDRARPEKLGSTHALVLSPEDTLLHLCLHLAHDNQMLGRLRDLCDLREVVLCTGRSFDWRVLRRRAHIYGIEQYVYYSLSVASQLVEATLPEDVLKELQCASPGGGVEQKLFGAALKYLFLGAPQPDSPVPDWLIRACIGEAQRDRNAAAKMLSLLGVGFRAFRDSAAVRVAKPRWAALIYAAFVHPFVLAARVASRFIQNR